MARDEVVVRFADGAELREFLSFELSEKFSNPLDSFSFQAAPSERNRKSYLDRLLKGELITITLNGLPQAAMMIQEVTTTISPDGGLTLDVSAVSPIQILMESTVDVPTASKALKAAVPMIDMILQVVEPYGFNLVADESDVDVAKVKSGKTVSTKPTKHKGAKKKDATAEYNESVFGFITRMLSRAGMMLRCGTTSDGTFLYITAPHYDGQPLYAVKQARSGYGPIADRFIGEVTIVDSNESQFSFCEVVGESADDTAATRSNKPKARVTTDAINAQRPPFRASGPFPYKPKFHKDKECGDAVNTEAVAKFILGTRAEKAFAVQGTVGGFTSRNGTPWTVDTLCPVFVEATGLDEIMWISERSMKRNAEGDTTKLTFIPKGYLQLGDVPSEA